VLLSRQAKARSASGRGHGRDASSWSVFTKSLSLALADNLEMMEDRMAGYEQRLADQEARLGQLSQTTFNQPFSSTSTQPYIQTPSSGLSNLPLPLNPTNLQFDIQPEFNPLSGHTASPSGLSTTSFRDPQVLPPDDIVRDLITLFFTHIHPWAPILSPTLPHYTQPWNIVVHAIVVVSLRLSNDPRLLHANTKQTYRAAAKQHILAHAIESTSIDSVQALALLALDLIGSEQGPSSWGILALLTRSAVHLGLAVEEDSSNFFMAGRAPTPSLSRTSIIPPAGNWHEDELRRRLFWLIFCLDRYACVSTGWDFALPDFDIKRRLPASDELWMKNVSETQSSSSVNCTSARLLPFPPYHPANTCTGPCGCLLTWS
jgi:hypothetical protein